MLTKAIACLLIFTFTITNTAYGATLRNIPPAESKTGTTAVVTRMAGPDDAQEAESLGMTDKEQQDIKRRFVILAIMNLCHSGGSLLEKCLITVDDITSKADVLFQDPPKEIKTLESELDILADGFKNLYTGAKELASSKTSAVPDELISDIQGVCNKARSVSSTVANFETRNLMAPDDLNTIKNNLRKFITSMQELLDSAEGSLRPEPIDLNETIKAAGQKCHLDMAEELKWNLNLSDDERVKNFLTHFRYLWAYLFKYLFDNSLEHGFKYRPPGGGAATSMTQKVFEAEVVGPMMLERGESGPEESFEIAGILFGIIDIGNQDSEPGKPKTKRDAQILEPTLRALASFCQSYNQEHPGQELRVDHGIIIPGPPHNMRVRRRGAFLFILTPYQ